MFKMLNTAQLKKLIVNEIKRLRETPRMDWIGELGVINDTFLESLEDYWMSTAEGDPSIEHDGAVAGFDMWQKQVEAAVAEAEVRINKVINEIDQKLINGEYYQG